ncbi:type II secretion system minor pseudopilin GspI [Saccharophagus degradans]|uniref:Type II secretion system protein I n=1 Tax=Saccharophagus degradans (strain 2-40 / ATCC 43961 / DSM 17024) TaxID=203122 RepID=Q21EP9_SACD2|nr:type II secretion system minor pseudopilin GspI [Saccharophagus degradans]ABD82830.1 General secretion pathway protein I [Saccharophagus degradans 2-40]
MMLSRKLKGFTLIEVLVALVVIGMALPALALRFQSMLDHTGRMEQKNYAYWIAQNKLNEIQLERNLKGAFTKIKKTDEIEYGGREWVYSIETIDTEVKGIYRIEVSVGEAKDQWLASLAGFISE